MSSCLAKGSYLEPTAISSSGELRPSWSTTISATAQARVYPVSSVNYVFNAFTDSATLQCVMNAVMLKDYRHTELGFTATANQIPTSLNVALTPPAGFKLMVAGFNFDGTAHGSPAVLHHLLLLIAKDGYVEWVELGALAGVGGDKTLPTADMTKALAELESASITALSRPGL